jgi:alkylation response protein AidB-like acyl-CoA dehydrogenase
MPTATEVHHDATETDDAFRARLQAFFTVRHPGRAPQDPAERLEWQRAWCATLVDEGYAGPSWPRAYGGMDLSFPRQVMYAEEAAQARVPGHPGSGVPIAGPTIIRYGSEEQRRRWLRPMLRAEHIWAQGYSEPDAGSDLPSLRTRAERHGDVYVVTGTKLWSSWAELADVLFTLVRTGPLEARQHGITYLVIDARTPGIIVRPIRDLTGRAEFCELVFDGVEVPVSNRIGEEGGGWPIARTSLGHERAAGAVSQAARYRRIVDELVSMAQELGATADPVVRQRLARAVSDVRIMAVAGARTISDIVHRGEPGPGSSVSRLFISTFEQRLHELAVDITGAYGMLTGADAPQRGRWVWGLLRTRASTIGAGTAEIQRNTIAERVLGLPRDPSTAPEG